MAYKRLLIVEVIGCSGCIYANDPNHADYCCYGKQSLALKLKNRNEVPNWCPLPMIAPEEE